MTREEAIKNIKEHCYFANLNPQAKEALDMAIKALEQEIDEDAISRELVNEFIDSIPPIIPQQKSGRWIHFSQSDDCSECGWSTGKYVSPSNYCPNCGCRMVKP